MGVHSARPSPSPSPPALCSRRRAFTRERHPRRGAISVFGALVGLLFIGFLGLVVDIAYVKLTAQELQAAADAAALSAAQKLHTDDGSNGYAATRQEAIDIALANEAAASLVQISANTANAPDGDVVIGVWDAATHTFTPDMNDPDAVRVVARRTGSSLGGKLSLFFGSIFGTSESDVARDAVAQLGNANAPAILILDPHLDQALDIRGNATMTALQGVVQVNSDDPCALYLNGVPDVPRLVAKKVFVTGGACTPVNSVKPPPIEGAEPIPDPFASVPQPDPALMTPQGSIRGAGTYSPGYYSGGVDFNGGVAKLLPGIYYFDDQGIELNGNARLEGDEVMLFIGEKGRFKISGNQPGFDMSPPTSGIYAGFSVFQHRSNNRASDISGSGEFVVDGIMYLPAGHLEMDGNVTREIGMICVNTQRLRGNGSYEITGKGPEPPTPLYPYLVE